MKHTIPMALLVALMSAPAAHAAGAPSGAAAPVTAQDMDAHLARMQESAQRMQEQVTRLRHTPDPQARQTLMAEHRQTMHAHMQMMYAMAGGQHHGGGMGGQHHGGNMGMHGGGSDMMAQCMAMMQPPGSAAPPPKR